jgi:hypothetical protein
MTTQDLATIEALAQAARCIDGDDRGSERQIAAFNAFTTAASVLMSPEQQDAWNDFSIKATSDEIVDEPSASFADDRRPSGRDESKQPAQCGAGFEPPLF